MDRGLQMLIPITSWTEIPYYPKILHSSNSLKHHTELQNYTGCLKIIFTTLKAYIKLLRGYVQYFELSTCSKS
jgi:hypothetical protein